MTNQDTRPEFFELKNKAVSDLDECIREMEARVAELRSYRHSVARSENIPAATSNLVYAVGVMTAQPVRSMSIQDAMFRIAELGRLFPQTEIEA